MFGSDEHPARPGEGRLLSAVEISNSPGRCRFHAAEPVEANSSNPRPSGRPWATRDAEKVPTAPLPNVAVNVATSSFSTGATSSLTAALVWPYVTPIGTGRSLIKVAKAAPPTSVIGPQTNSLRSIR